MKAAYAQAACDTAAAGRDSDVGTAAKQENYGDPYAEPQRDYEIEDHNFGGPANQAPAAAAQNI